MHSTIHTQFADDAFETTNSIQINNTERQRENKKCRDACEWRSLYFKCLFSKWSPDGGVKLSYRIDRLMASITAFCTIKPLYTTYKPLCRSHCLTTIHFVSNLHDNSTRLFEFSVDWIGLMPSIYLNV